VEDGVGPGDASLGQDEARRMTPQPPAATGWQFALAILSNWHKTIAVIIIIMLLGWPTVVIIDMGQDLGFWGSAGSREQQSRQAEHRGQTAVLTEIAAGMKEVTTALQAHNLQSIRKDDIIAYLLSEDCEKADLTKFQRRRCTRLQAFMEADLKRVKHGH